MPWLLDTNHWILLLKGRCPPLQERLDRVDPAEVWLCPVVKEELFHGAHKYGNAEARLMLVTANGEEFGRVAGLKCEDWSWQ